MSRIPSAGKAPQIPASVMISSLAIAAGAAGQSLAVCFREYPAPLLCEMWKRLTAAFDAEKVCHVRTAKDVRDLTSRISDVRIVIVHASRLLISVNWAIQFSRFEDTATAPTVLTSSVAENLDEDPGATLVLQSDPSEISLIENWLFHVSERRIERTYEGWPPVNNLDPRLDSVLRRASSSRAAGHGRLRHYLVLRRLLAGACLHRVTPDDNSSRDSTSITLEDYDFVRRLLQSRIVSPGQELCDPLAIAMINRANVFLEVKYDPHATDSNPFYSVSDYPNLSRRAPRELITRREIADLGNTRSTTVCRLTDYLKTQAGGYQAIRRMGFRRRPPTQEQWRSSEAESVASQLLTWSPKQVRTHFDRLQNAKLVSAERQHDNGPWRYVLPEELSTAASPFRELPIVADLESI